MAGGDNTAPVVTQYGDIPELKGFSYATFFPTSRAILVKEDFSPSVRIEWLARTSEKSWSEHDFIALFDGLDVAPDAFESKGPLNVAVLAKKELDNETRSSVMVFGDVDFLTNAYLNVSGNKDLAINCINMMLGEGSLISIDKKTAQDRPFILTPTQNLIIFWIPVVVIPSLIMSICLAVFLIRRRA